MKLSLFQKWINQINKEIPQYPFFSSNKKSLEKIKLKSLYSNNPSFKNSNMPGLFPFLRGPKSSMYTNRPWTIRQYAGFSTAKESNDFYRKALSSGQSGLSIAFDLPTHRGFDSNDINVFSDVGKTGVPIDTVEDMKILLSNIPLDKTSISMTMNGSVLPIMASYIVAAEESGVSQKLLKGTIQNDILKEFLVRNTYIYPPKESMRIVSDIIKYTHTNMPYFNPISISGYHIHEAGADIILELALTMANGLEYIKSMLNYGLTIDDFASRFSFFFASGMDFYLEIAKLRAARVIWANLINRFNPKLNKSKLLRTHCQTSGWSLTTKDPYNNIIRTTIEAMSSIFGGTQSLHTNAFDEALSLPTEHSAAIARNTQLILLKETNIPSVIDPWGGSYLIESLTLNIINKVSYLLKKIKTLGGMTNAIIKGIPQQWIEENSIKKQVSIDNLDKQIIGVNSFKSKNEYTSNVKYINNLHIVKQQSSSISIIKKHRNNKLVNQSLRYLKESTYSSENLLSATIIAIKHRATLGEVSKTLESSFGRFIQKNNIIKNLYKSLYKDSNEISYLKKNISLFHKEFSSTPSILISKIGQDGHDRGAKYIASAFSDIGFNVHISPLFQSPKNIVDYAINNHIHIIGISSLAGGHNIFVSKIVKYLKDIHNKTIIIVIGGIIPSSDFSSLFKSGASLIYTQNSNPINSAKEILNTLNLKLKLNKKIQI